MLVLTVPGIFVSIAMVAVFCVINMFGVKFFAQFNNVLVWWKLIVIVLVFIGLALLAFNPGHFHMPEFGGFAPNGIAPIFAALPAAGIVFSYLGFRQGVEFAGETKNLQRNVPFAVIGSIVLTGTIASFCRSRSSAPSPPICSGTVGADCRSRTRRDHGQRSRSCSARCGWRSSSTSMPSSLRPTPA
ncbi:hypothetical protein GCM10009690_32640 [Brevibacterium permense]|uniref:Amino acid permease n=1 Tax=Brevibacterium permense TaxID=234834 RepID=A0ABP4LLY5_9MICO